MLCFQHEPCFLSLRHYNTYTTLDVAQVVEHYNSGAAREAWESSSLAVARARQGLGIE